MAKRTTRDRRMFNTLEEAQNSGHPNMNDKGWAIFIVTTPAGKQVYTIAPGHGDALINAAKHDGYVVSTQGKQPTKDSVGALLASLSAEDRAALLSQYAGKGKK